MLSSQVETIRKYFLSKKCFRLSRDRNLVLAVFKVNRDNPLSEVGRVTSRVARTVCFQTKNPNLGKFWRALDWKIFGISYGDLGYLMKIWDILWRFGISYGDLGYLIEIWYILWPFGTFCIYLVHFSGLGIMYQEKSENPGD
jgi:hypothetical protein